MAASTVKKGVLWTGSDDGLIHVTQDGGITWKNVTPPDMLEVSDVYEVEASPHDAGTAYFAISRYRTANDFKPYLFKTSDYGKTWTNLSKNFPQERDYPHHPRGHGAQGAALRRNRDRYILPPSMTEPPGSV